MPHAVDDFLPRFNKKFKLGKIGHGTDRIRLYGVNLIPHDDMSCHIDDDDKLNALPPYPISPVCRREIKEVLNKIEKFVFMSLNSSLGWLRLAGYPFCAFSTSYQQQKISSATIAALI